MTKCQGCSDHYIETDDNDHVGYCPSCGQVINIIEEVQREGSA